MKNFPDPIIARLLRILVFPLGQPFSLPKDKLDHKVASLILSPGPARDRLTEGIFLPKKDQMKRDEPLWNLEDALEKVINAEPIEKKIREAERKGLLKPEDLEKELEDAVRVDALTKEEVKILQASYEARNEVIRVDDFPQK